MNRPTTTGEVEQRSAPDAPITVEAKRLRGVIPYGTPSRDLGGWTEIIDRGAFASTKMGDLLANVDHAGLPLGRFDTTLTVEDRSDGLHWACELPESRADVREAVERGDLKSGSWRMVVAKGGDEWRGNVRHVRNVAELHHVSVVSTPAYDASVAELRSAPEQQPESVSANRQQQTEPTPEAPVPESPPAGGLRVEDRQHHTTPKGTAEDRVMAAIAGVPPGEMRDLTHASASPVEPDDLRTVLIDKFREASVMAAAGVPIVPTDKKNVVWPTLTGDTTAAFYDELEEITESDPGLDEFEVPVKAIKCLTRMSSESVEDSDPDLLRLVTTNLTTTMVLKGDRELLVGNDPKGFTGLMNLTGTGSLAVGGPLSWDHILKAQAMLIEALVPPPYVAILGPRPLLGLDLLKVLASGSNEYVGRPSGVPPVFSSGWFNVTGGASPKTTGVVFAPQQCTIVLRRQIVVEIDKSQEFTSDAVLARGRYRLGFGCVHPQAVVKLSAIDAPAIS